jgi:hypothetical protein
VFSEEEKDFDLVFTALKTGRSLAASYNVQSDIQCISFLWFSPSPLELTFEFSLYPHPNFPRD